jgi:hypothetical protein
VRVQLSALRVGFDGGMRQLLKPNPCNGERRTGLPWCCDGPPHAGRVDDVELPVGGPGEHEHEVLAQRERSCVALAELSDASHGPHDVGGDCAGIAVNRVDPLDCLEQRRDVN